MKNKTKLEDVLKVIDKWSKDNDVIFFGDFIEFDEKGEVKDSSRMFCYGKKKTLVIGLKEFNKLFKADKEEFIN